ncbi:DUF572-domain-containing protein [Pleurostoma richardsiae]|uniref:Splicing factor YJU2 n=1 Tax=Pleurostoma richardsiae TaxID=41990 RepID=A0AA38S073_9PEZI|nr:DUF572-domain-containing protein [Pleurostoma richardsiae]
MSERKVLSKYYPPDFDPRQLTRSRGPKQTGPRVQTVRLMAPFSMMCTTCGEYIYKGRKFNARKETPDEKYLGIQIYRFYIRCTRCSAEITFRTDPKTQDYTCERGAKRNTEPWRRNTVEETDEERLDRLEREAREEEDEQERNAMAELEAKTADAKREMAIADALDEIRTRNARLERADRDGVEAMALARPADDERRLQEEREDEEAARRAFASARAQERLEEPIGDEERLSSGVASGSGSNSGGAAAAPPAAASVVAAPVNPAPAKELKEAKDLMPPPSFKRQVKKKKDHAALLGIKKKPSLV